MEHHPIHSRVPPGPLRPAKELLPRVEPDGAGPVGTVRAAGVTRVGPVKAAARAEDHAAPIALGAPG